VDIDLTALRYADTVPGMVRQAFARAEQLYDAAAVERAVDRLAVRLTVSWQNDDPLLITLLPDGFVLGGMLMRRLVFPCRHTAVQADAAGCPALAAADEVAGSKVAVMVANVSAADAHVLQQWAQRNGAAELLLLALAAESEPPLQDTPPEVWAALRAAPGGLFGSGLGVAGYGANLPGLYRLPHAADTDSSTANTTD